MTPLRSTFTFVLATALLGGGCAVNTPEGRMRPDTPASVQQELGYNDAIRYGQEYATAQGYEVTEVAEAQQLRPNYWRIRFGLAPRGSGRLLDVDFDQVERRVTKSTEVGGAAGRVTPAP